MWWKRFVLLSLSIGSLSIGWAFFLGGCGKEGSTVGMVLIPAGEFTMGSSQVDAEAQALQFGSKKPWYVNEKPDHRVLVKDFYLDRYEVTNGQYKRFVDETGYPPPPHWRHGTFPPPLVGHPVTNVRWSDAQAYCEWAGKRLPTEAEWEKAARGTDGRIYPWGNRFDHARTNCFGLQGGTTQVMAFEGDKSPYGVQGMAGNVMEWTADWYKPYPGSKSQDKDFGEKFRVVRGGGWGGMGHYSFDYYYRNTRRTQALPQMSFNDVGFRCAMSP